MCHVRIVIANACQMECRTYPEHVKFVSLDMIHSNYSVYVITLFIICIQMCSHENYMPYFTANDIHYRLDHSQLTNCMFNDWPRSLIIPLPPAYPFLYPLLFPPGRVLCKCQSIICKGTSICSNGMYQFIADHIVSITPIRQWPTDYYFNLNIVQFIRIGRNSIESALRCKWNSLLLFRPSFSIIECHKGTHETKAEEKKFPIKMNYYFWWTSYILKLSWIDRNMGNYSIKKILKKS